MMASAVAATMPASEVCTMSWRRWAGVSTASFRAATLPSPWALRVSMRARMAVMTMTENATEASTSMVR